MKSAILALLVASASAAKLHDSVPYFNEPAFHDRMPVGAGFVQLEASACLAHKVDGVTCLGDAQLFASGMEGSEDLGVDITAETAKKYATKDSIKEFATIDSVKSLENDMASIYLRIKILETKTIELAETDTKLQGSIQSLEKMV